MKKRRRSQPVFKPYHQNQVVLLPPSIDEMITPGHLVRLVSVAVDRISIDSILSTYKGGGTSSWHPRMMLKVVVYAYTQRIYSSRRIAKALREDIHFMWLSGGNRPDFRTLNNFRSSRLKGVIDEVFTAILELLIEEGLVKFEDLYLDGTKLESSANRYTFVWAKTVKRNKGKLQDKIRILLDQIDRVNEEENREYGDRDLEEVGGEEGFDSERLKKRLTELQDRLKGQPEDDALKKACKTIEKDLLPRQERYEQQEDLLGGRNSCSKTDPDATFMRMKGDMAGSCQLRPGYNVQMGVEGQFVLSYSIHQNPGDTGHLIPHLEELKARWGKLPRHLIADGAYGSEENYQYLEGQQVEAYVKYPSFHFEKTRKFREDMFRSENLPYEEETDTYVCPGGKKLRYLYDSSHVTANGYRSWFSVYESEGCSDCPLKSRCHKGEGNRRIRVNKTLRGYRRKARELLETDEGRRYRSQRGVEVESVFGQIKQNMGFRRFMLRGLEKISIEYGLLAIAHNLKKWKRNRKGSDAEPYGILSFFRFCFQFA